MAQRPDFDNPKRWEIHEDLNVFAEHSRSVKGKDGRAKTVKFTKSDLEEIVRNGNERDRIGQPCPLTLGHTDDDGPETRQPPIVGYARKFKLAYDRSLKRWVIRAHYYLRRDRAAEAREYPRTSVEVWANQKFFDPIALLKRTPQLDLGQWTYSRGNDLKLRYSMDDLHDDRDDREPEFGGGGHEPPGHEPEGEGEHEGEHEGGHDGPEGVPPDFHAHFQKCMAHHGITGSKKFGMGEGGTDVPAMPGVGKPPLPRRPGMPEEERGRMRKTPEDLRFEKLEKMMYRMGRRLDASLNERDDLAVKYRRSEARDAVREAFKGKICDLETEVDQYLRQPEDEQDEYLRYRRSTLTDDPSALPDVPLRNDRPRMGRTGRGENERVRVTGGSEGGGRPSDAGLGDLGEDEYDRAVDFIRANPECTEADAVRYARGERAIKNGKAAR